MTQYKVLANICALACLAAGCMEPGEARAHSRTGVPHGQPALYDPQLHVACYSLGYHTLSCVKVDPKRVD